MQPIKNENGNTERILSNGFEVTQQVESLQQIEESATATDSSNVGTWSLDMQTQILEWSTMHKKLWGYDDNRTDLTYEDWHKIISYEDIVKAIQKVEEVRIKGTVEESNYYIR